MPPKPHPTVQEDLSIHDLSLPRTLITRLAKSVLPPQTALQRASVQALEQASTVFINFVCATANDLARRDGRKAIAANDILQALRVVEFERFLPRLEAELEVFTAAEAAKKQKTSTATVATTEKGKGGENEDMPATTPMGQATPIAKKPRVTPGTPEAAGDPVSNEDEDEDADVDVLVSDEDDDGEVVSDDEDEAVLVVGEEDEEDEDRDHATTEDDDDDEALDEGAISD